MKIQLSRYVLICCCLALAGSVQAVELWEKDGKKIDLNLEIQVGLFNGKDAYFGQGEAFVGANVDNWSESSGEVGIALELPAASSTFFGEFSQVHTRTYDDDASGFTVGDDNPTNTSTEQNHIGWRSGTLFSSLDENALTVKVGRFDYLVGSGLLIADGGGDGGDRGGWWLGARKTFKDAVLVTFDTGPWKVEGFFIKNEPRRGGARGKAIGANAEYRFESSNLDLGLLAYQISDTGGSVFTRYDTVAGRFEWGPLEPLTLSGEYVDQSKNGNEGEGWYLNTAWQWSESFWKPTLGYRYSHFSGDDLATPENEGFRPAAYGFTDYGTWYQGEITGNYPLDNSNLNTHMLRLTLVPHEDVTLNAIYYDFTLDEEQIFGDPVGDDDFGDEVNISADWAARENIFVIATVGMLMPGNAAETWTGGDEDWFYTMLYMSYTY